MEGALAALRETKYQDVDAVCDAAALLCQLMINILVNPDTQILRRMRRTNRHIASQLLVAPGMEEALRIIGWGPPTDEDDLEDAGREEVLFFKGDTDDLGQAVVQITEVVTWLRNRGWSDEEGEFELLREPRAFNLGEQPVKLNLHPPQPSPHAESRKDDGKLNPRALDTRNGESHSKVVGLSENSDELDADSSSDEELVLDFNQIG